MPKIFFILPEIWKGYSIYINNRKVEFVPFFRKFNSNYCFNENFEKQLL